MSKTKKRLIFWKHDYSKFQTKWDILFTHMGLSDRHFISQPLEQRIITIWNKIKFSDFRKKKKYWSRKISKGNHPWDEVVCGNGEAGDHIHFVGGKKIQKRGPGKKPSSGSNLDCPLPHLHYHKQLHLRGDFPEKFSCFKFFFWLFLRAENLVLLQIWDYSLF